MIRCDDALVPTACLVVAPCHRTLNVVEGAPRTGGAGLQGRRCLA